MTRERENLDRPTRERCSWQTVFTVAGPIVSPKHKDYILPLISLRRISNALEEDAVSMARRYGNLQAAQNLVWTVGSLVPDYFYLWHAGHFSCATVFRDGATRKAC